MVEKRQIHETKGSYYLYLPKKWITENKIDESKAVSLIDYFPEQLILKKDTDIFEESREVVILLDAINEDKSMLKNYIIASYITGANKITIKSNSDVIKPHLREEVSEQIKKLSSFEITYEDDKLIQSKEMSKFLDINSTIQTLFSRTQNMFQQVERITSDPTKDQETLRAELKIIIKTDDDIDRFKHMVDRLSHLILNDPSLIAIQKLDTIKILHDTQIASNIERIADHIVELSKFIRSNVSEMKILKESETEDHETQENEVERPENRLSKAIDFFKSLSEFYIKTNISYLDALGLYKQIHTEEKEIQKELKRNFNFVIYHIGRIFSYCENIAEILINQSAYELYNVKKDEDYN